MKKKIIYGFIACVLSGIVTFVSETSVAQEKAELSQQEAESISGKESPGQILDAYHGPTVTISGKVTYADYKEGQRIMVTAKSSQAKGPPDIAYVEISGSGEYSLKVPRYAGAVYIGAAILESGEKELSEKSLIRMYGNNPLKVGKSDISGIDVAIKAGGQPSYLSTYQGPTVTIWGKIDFPNYKEGQRIRVTAKSSKVKGVPDIAYAEIPRPGEYSLKVPQNIGDVYIGAVVLEPGKRELSAKSLTRMYSKNPLKIGKSDIRGIEISIKAGTRHAPMAAYEGTTVTISGKVTYADYKEGQRIRVIAKSSKVKGPPDIAYAEITQPGEYSLKVPQNIGDVYIGAVVIEPKEKSPGEKNPRAQYKGAIEVKTSDISGIDIPIQYNASD